MIDIVDASLLRPYGLHIEQRHEPLGIDVAQPRMSWMLESDRRGTARSAYRPEHGGFQAAAMNSFNHCSFGRVAGIDQTPTSVAYRELLLRPRPGGRLTWARAQQQVARGHVACGCSISDGRITVTTAVPPGSTAVLEIPTADPGSVLESGAPAATQPGAYASNPSPAVQSCGWLPAATRSARSRLALTFHPSNAILPSGRRHEDSQGASCRGRSGRRARASGL